LSIIAQLGFETVQGVLTGTIDGSETRR